ncbi:glycosyl transferase family 1 [Bacillus mycoides]|uniref:glycosyltransferase family 1 protein n=1 Tax=Bacillus mycoides TaxID=1405 RepID=UPI000BF7E281|nr:glycosyltransferase family 1 protein [Bacillus mycoides]PFX92315.1 glycosyl transferase family 1 [Bacillus mycoides]QWH79525.1 glycosyltransferase family 1 protein [Bacillus mycoides]QWI44571.1 glycosyltransferase family 1 protein [Bacillus mycoides]
MVKTKKNKRVLHIVSAMNRGGAETLLMSIYRKIDKQKLQFDFVSHGSGKCDYEDEIAALGGSVYRIPSLGQVGPLVYIKELIKIMSNGQYVAVHAHTDYQGGFVAVAAKMAGINRRICHSHSNNWPQGSGVAARVTLKVLQSIIKYAGTDYCACSIEAARFLFGERMLNDNKVQLIKNGLDINQFIDVDIGDIDGVRKELCIPDAAKLVGHIGRFSESKNHIFILQVLKEILKRDTNFIAILAGDGPLKASIELKAKELGIYENIRFLGVRTDVPVIMNVLDVFIFPSLFEGFGIVTLEAQCAGVPCVVADTIPKNTDMGLGIMSFVGLDEKIEIWSTEIYKALLKERPEKGVIINNISKLGFDINNNILDWLTLYGIEDKEVIR